MLYLANAVTVAYVGGVVIANLGIGLAEILLDFLFRAEVVEQEVHLAFDLLLYHRLAYEHGVEIGLMKKQTFDRHLLGQSAIGVAFYWHTLLQRLLIILFNFRFIDRIVADNPSHFVHDVVLGCCRD